MVDQVRRRVSPNGDVTGEELTEIAGTELERYAERLLQELFSVDRGSDHPEVWIRRQFAEGLERAGAALREALADSRHRHTVAQGLQRKMFEAELMLRRAIKLKWPAKTTPAIAS
jgi:hypothetical protein